MTNAFSRSDVASFELNMDAALVCCINSTTMYLEAINQMDITQFHANGIFLLLIVLSYTIISLCINTLLQYVYYIDSCHCLIHLSLLAYWLVLSLCAFTHYSYRITYPVSS